MMRQLLAPRRVVARAAALLAIAGATLAFLPRPAEAQELYNIHFVRLQCVEETDGLGSDETYVVMFSADLQPAVPETNASRTRLFNDVDSGENHRDTVRTWGLRGGARRIDNLDNVILLAAVLESDGSDRGVVKATAEAHLNANLPFYVAAYRARRITRATMISRLITDMNNALDLARADGGDDRIGSAQELRPTPGNLLDARSGLSVPLSTGVFRGDGGRYILHFDLTHTPR